MVSTASRVGTGNIASVATAIATGGPGAVFWMWLMAIVGAASAFVESTLAQIFKVRGEDGEFRGGPAYYIEQGLGKRWLGVVFAVLLILCFAFGFNGLQSFNATSSLTYYTGDCEMSTRAAIASGIVLAAMTPSSSLAARSASASSPVPRSRYGAHLHRDCRVDHREQHWRELPAVFGLMFASAFDFQSIFGGFAGSVVMLGIKRGLYSNEAGMGSLPNAAATARAFRTRSSRAWSRAFRCTSTRCSFAPARP